MVHVLPGTEEESNGGMVDTAIRLWPIWTTLGWVPGDPIADAVSQCICIRRPGLCLVCRKLYPISKWNKWKLISAYYSRRHLVSLQDIRAIPWADNSAGEYSIYCSLTLAALEKWEAIDIVKKEDLQSITVVVLLNNKTLYLDICQSAIKNCLNQHERIDPSANPLAQRKVCFSYAENWESAQWIKRKLTPACVLLYWANYSAPCTFSPDLPLLCWRFWLCCHCRSHYCSFLQSCQHLCFHCLCCCFCGIFALGMVSHHCWNWCDVMVLNAC